MWQRLRNPGCDARKVFWELLHSNKMGLGEAMQARVCKSTRMNQALGPTREQRTRPEQTRAAVSRLEKQQEQRQVRLGPYKTTKQGCSSTVKQKVKQPRQLRLLKSKEGDGYESRVEISNDFAESDLTSLMKLKDQ